MIPESIRREIEAAGGLYGAPEPQGNGTTLYRARSGNYFVVVDATGTLSMRGYAPPVDPSDTPPAPAESPRGIGLSQRELESQLAQFGALGPADFREETKQEDIPNPASTANGGIDPQAPITIKGPVTYRTWVKPGTSQRLTVRVNSDQTYTPVFSGADPDIKPGQQASGPPGGVAWRDDGPEVGPTGRRWGWNPETRAYDQNLGPSPAAQGIGQQSKPAGPKGDTAVIRGHLMEFNPASGKYDIDHGPTAAPATKTPIVEQVSGGDGKKYIRTITFDEAGNPTIKSYGPDGKSVASIPGEQAETKASVVTGGDDKPYTIVSAKDANGNPVVRTYDANGNPVSSVPPKRAAATTRYNPDTGEYEQVTTDDKGNPIVRTVPREGATASGPKRPAPGFPHFVAGMAADALKPAYDAIQAEVDAGRQTPAWGENRRKEIMEAAKFTVQEAQSIEQSRQFNQTMDFNLGNTRLQHMSSSLTQALQFALSINGKIKKGSAAGANLFRAYFNMQMQFLHDSGLENMQGSGGQSAFGSPSTRAPGTAPTQAERRPPPKIDPGNPKSVEAAADATESGIAASLNAPPSFMTPTGAQSPAPQPSAPPSPPISREPVLTSPMQSPGGGPKITVRDPYGNEFEVTQQQLDNRPGGSKDLTIVGPTPAPQSMTDQTGNPYAAPLAAGQAFMDMRRDTPITQFDATPQFAAMESLKMSPPPPIDVPRIDVPSPDTMGTDLPHALQMAQIRATPPWRLPPEQLPDLVRQYGEENVFSIPGMEGAA